MAGSRCAVKSRYKIQLEVERCVFYHFLHDKERAGLPNARQRNQLLAVQPIEIGNVLYADLEKKIEVASHQMAVEHERQFPDRRFKGGKSLLCRAIEDHADDDKRPALDLGRRNIGAHGTN